MIEQVVRPEDHEGLTFDLTHGYGAPGTAVAALVAIVAHGKDVPLRDLERHPVRELCPELLRRELVIRKSVVIGQEVGGAKGGKIVAGAEAGGGTRFVYASSLTATPLT